MESEKTYSAETVEILRELTKLNTINISMSDKVDSIHRSNKRQWQKIDEIEKTMTVNKECIRNIAEKQKNTNRIIYTSIGTILSFITAIIVKLIKY